MAKLVKLYPLFAETGVSLYPYSTDGPIELPEDEAEFVLSHQPPPFTKRKPPEPEAVEASKEE